MNTQLEIWESETPSADPEGPETWRSIPGFPRYEASTHGRFRRGTRILHGSPNHNGYTHIGLISPTLNRQDFRLAHRLIAETFLDKPITDKYLVINHKNGKRGDNRVANLEWATISHNNKEWRHRTQHKESP